MPRWVIIRLLALILPALAIIILLEGILHFTFFITKNYWLFVGPTSYESKAYAKHVSDRRQYSLRENYSDKLYTINAEGFRGTGFRTDDRRPVICILGDSVPFGYRVADHETFPYHLQTMLDEKNYLYRVLNGGVPSYNLRQSIDRWANDILPRYKCEVITLFAANDVSLILTYGTKWTPDITWGESRFGISGKYYSSIAFFIRYAIRWLPRSDGMTPQEIALVALGDDLRNQIGRLQAAGIPVVVMPVNPCYYQSFPIGHSRNLTACSGAPSFAASAGEWDPLMRKINLLLASTAAPPAVTFLDTIAPFDNILGREGKYVDFIHLSDIGNHAMAKIIADYLIEKHLIRK